MSAPFRNAPGADRGVEVVKRKVCMVGEQGVGKTSLVRRFTTGTFDDMYVRTLGASVSKKAVELETVYGRTVRVEFVILDIVGRRTFLQLFQDAYFSGAAGVVGVFERYGHSVVFKIPARRHSWTTASFRRAHSVEAVESRARSMRSQPGAISGASGRRQARNRRRARFRWTAPPIRRPARTAKRDRSRSLRQATRTTSGCAKDLPALRTR